jgi:hypothetical protein
MRAWLCALAANAEPMILPALVAVALLALVLAQ